MEIREWATRVFSADSLEGKLFLPEGGLKSMTDHRPGNPIPWSKPPRCAGLAIAPKHTRFKFPSVKSLQQKDMRVRCLHTFANHELMALEMMAWALLAFPQASPSFRKGLVSVLIDEQRHFRLYSDRLEQMGASFGVLPINDHFWRMGPQISCPLDWICTMHLTFEQANLDHAPFYARIFQEVDDPESSRLMQVIFEDEMRHVGFGAHWLNRLKPEDSSPFQTFLSHCSEELMPDRARGFHFQTEARQKAGLDDDFIRSVQTWSPTAT